MLELVGSSRPTTEYGGKGGKGGWSCNLSSFVDGGKKLAASGKGAAKGDAEVGPGKYDIARHVIQCI